VISGEAGMDREVTSVSVMDAPDIYDWLRGGEALLTSGYVFKDNPEGLTSLVEKIYQAGAAAFFIKTDRFIGKLPEATLAVSNKLAFPIVHMPREYAFVDVINPVLSRIVWEQSETIKYSVRIHNAFIDIALHGGDVRKVLETMKELLTFDVVFIDTMFKKLYTLPGVKVEDNLEEIFLTKYKCFPVRSDHSMYGYFVLVGQTDGIGEYEKITLEHAATNVKLIMQKMISNRQVEKRYRDQFVEDLIYGNIKSEEELAQRAKLYDWVARGDYCVIIIDIDSFRRKFVGGERIETIASELNEMANSIFETAFSVFRKNQVSMIYASFTDYAVVVVNEMDEGIHKRVRNCTEYIRRQVNSRFNFTVTVCAGVAKKDAMKIHESFHEAQRARKIAEMIYGPDVVVYYGELSMYKMLEQIKDEATVREFYKETLGALILYDKEKGASLMRVLIDIVDNDWNLKKTAEMTYVHYNTMKYRYKKLAEILGMDLEKTANKLNIELAIRLYRLAENKTYIPREQNT
jgi:purine catabolism regulator